jgi:3'(2'), 5'-bisphosphate nucleotidase
MRLTSVVHRSSMVFNVRFDLNSLVSMPDVLSSMMAISREAGAAIMNIYGEDDFGVDLKDDNSPVTRADLAAHRIIVDGLEKLAPDIPILSEESEEIDYDIRSKWKRYFLVDPLDGTKEFINRNGEFTVNIALINDGIPVIGVVFVPVEDILYVGTQIDAPRAYLIISGQAREIKSRAVDAGQPLTLVASRRHGGEAMTSFVANLTPHFPEIETTNMGSSLKLCLVASGDADIYPRLAPTSEWDTAAAQAVVEAAGGAVLDLSLQPLRYNMKADILNPHFLVLGDTSFDWSAILTRFSRV